MGTLKWDAVGQEYVCPEPVRELPRRTRRVTPRCMLCGRFVKNYKERPYFIAGMGWYAQWTCSKCGEQTESI